MGRDWNSNPCVLRLRRPQLSWHRCPREQRAIGSVCSWHPADARADTQAHSPQSAPHESVFRPRVPACYVERPGHFTCADHALLSVQPTCNRILGMLAGDVYRNSLAWRSTSANHKKDINTNLMPDVGAARIIDPGLRGAGCPGPRRKVRGTLSRYLVPLACFLQACKRCA